jgi:hypothetical protein
MVPVVAKGFFGVRRIVSIVAQPVAAGYQAPTRQDFSPKAPRDVKTSVIRLAWVQAVDTQALVQNGWV